LLHSGLKFISASPPRDLYTVFLHAQGGKETDIYWCKLTIDGFAEFYSNSLSATDFVRDRLKQAELDGILVFREPGWGSGLRFFSRVVSGLTTATVRAIFRR
jgi:hypothetical protein